MGNNHYNLFVPFFYSRRLSPTLKKQFFFSGLSRSFIRFCLQLMKKIRYSIIFLIGLENILILENIFLVTLWPHLSIKS